MSESERRIPLTPGSSLHYHFIPFSSLKCIALIPSRIDHTRIVLALPPGDQTAEAAISGIARWASEFLRNGWLVASPIAPEHTLFFQGGEAQLPVFMDQLSDRFGLEHAKINLFGISHGGNSAFRAATMMPNRFCSITVMPGFPVGPDAKTLGKLKLIPINFVVGSEDPFLKRSHKAYRNLAATNPLASMFTIDRHGHDAYKSISFEYLENLLLRRS
jgi:predicted esterase